MSGSIYIEEYSAKSFVVRGETRQYRDSLKAMGGKWNSRLTDKETGENFGAWLFWADKLEEVQEWLNNGCKVVENTRVGTSNQTSNQDIKHLEAKLDRVTMMLEALCDLHDITIDDPKLSRAARTARGGKKTNNPLVDTAGEDVIFFEEEEKTPPRRLLRPRRQ